MLEESSTTNPLSNSENTFNRRDFAKMATLGAAATTTVVGAQVSAADCPDLDCAEVNPDVVLARITSPCERGYVGVRCSNLLNALNHDDGHPDITVQELVYESFHQVLESLIDGDQDATRSTLLTGLRDAVAAYNSAASRTTSFADLLIHDMANPPSGATHQAQWTAIYNSAYAVHAGILFGHVYPLVFLNLNSGQRASVKNLLEDTSIGFRDRVGHYPFIDLYTKCASSVCKTINTDCFDLMGYLQIRSAFELGVFKVSVGSPYDPTCNFTFKEEGGPRILVKNNDECWSTSAGGCVPMHEKYCNDVGGEPSASSDICP